MQRRIAEVNTPDLARCDGFKFSSGVSARNLVEFANEYGYLIPTERDAETPLEELEGWDAWVLLLAGEGRCIVRVRYGEGAIPPPVIGDQRGVNKSTKRKREARDTILEEEARANAPRR